MDSPQSVVSPFKSSSVFAESENQNTSLVRNGCLSKENDVQMNGTAMCIDEGSIGVLEVFIHQARDIQNICIYHKQDVYAKICLTSNPENTVSTQTVNGGGKNPVFNENLKLNVRTIDSSLKCEIWMLSRVRNYLEDQLLGFALVPLSEVVIKNGKLEKDFCLSTNDMFHSPSGFVQLSLSYFGDSPDVMAIPAEPTSVASNGHVHDSEISESLPSELDKIEFPDPKIVNENHQMVSEYIAMPCNNLDSSSSESLVSPDTENHLNSEVGLNIVKNFSEGTAKSIEIPNRDSPPSCVSTTQSCDTPGESKSSTQEFFSPLKEELKEKKDGGDAESDSSCGLLNDTFPKPIVSINIEPEPQVVQQDIVDMYMKSMQQFTESLAKMKLPMDIENEPTNSGNSTSDQKLEAPKNTGPRVFYGSRAFF